MRDQYESDGVIFNNVKAGILTDQKITKTRYIYDDDGNIIGHNPVINSIDIDWNNAQVPGIENNIESTAKLLKIIGALNNAVKENPNSMQLLQHLLQNQLHQVIHLKILVQIYRYLI